MAGPTPGLVRPPAVAGLFYPADPDECRATAQQLLSMSPRDELRTSASAPDAGTTESERASRRLLGAVAPHAGWICSGQIAADAIATLARHAGGVDAVVVFGAVHTLLETDVAALDSAAAWSVPSGKAPVAEDVRGGLREKRELFEVDERFHRREHAVEVELPLIELSFGESAAIVPIEVPTIEQADSIGRAVARRVIALNRRAVFLASSDLTHYGPAYQFAPAGVGIGGLRWAKQNDRRLLDLVERYDVESIVPEVRSRQNACGGGAIAAMLAACRELGASRATVLRHASSYETLAELEPQSPANAVGYAAVVVG